MNEPLIQSAFRLLKLFIFHVGFKMFATCKTLAIKKKIKILTYISMKTVKDTYNFRHKINGKNNIIIYTVVSNVYFKKNLVLSYDILMYSKYFDNKI